MDNSTWNQYEDIEFIFLNKGADKNSLNITERVKYFNYVIFFILNGKHISH